MRRDTVLQFVYSACQGQEPGFGVTAQETADARKRGRFAR